MEKQPVMKEMLKRNLPNTPCLKSRDTFFLKVVCNGEGQETSCPRGPGQEVQPTLTPSFRTKKQEASLKTLAGQGERESSFM